MITYNNTDFVLNNDLEEEEFKATKMLGKYNYMNYLEYVNVGYIILNCDYSLFSQNKVILNYLSTERSFTSNSGNTFDYSKKSLTMKNDKNKINEMDMSDFHKSCSFISEREKKVISLFEGLFNNLIEIDDYFLSELSLIAELNNHIVPNDLNSESSSKTNGVLKFSEFFNKIKYKLNEEIFFKLGVSKFKIQNKLLYLELKVRMITLENNEIFYEVLTQDITKIIEAKIIKTQMIYKSLGLAKVAHDFKNPILSLISLLPSENTVVNTDSYISSADEEDSESETSIVHRSHTSHKKHSYFNKERSNAETNNLIRNFCSYMMMLIEDFNVYAKMDVERVKSEPNRSQTEKNSYCEFEIRPLLEFCVNIFKVRQINEKDKQKIKIRLVIEDNVPKKIAGVNETKLKQVLVNIISNSYKFTICGEIVVTAKVFYHEEIKRFLRITIQDTGVGISKEDQLTLFSPFKMIEKAKKLNQHGSGLGLLIIKEILMKLNSNIEFVSEPGHGTTFWFDIPINSAINRFCSKITYSEADSSSFIDQNFVFTESLTNLFKTLNNNLYFPDFNQFDELVNTDYLKNIRPQKHSSMNKIIIQEKFSTGTRDSVEKEITKRKSDKISKLLLSKKDLGFFDIKSRRETLLLSKKDYNAEKIDKLKKITRFLICDDEEIPKAAAHKLIVKICNEKMIEYDISFAKNGIECLFLLHEKVINQEPVNVLLIDDHMSVMNGSMTLRILDELINEKQMPNLLKFLVTSQENLVNKKILLQNGCDEVISKPITKEKIVQILQNKSLHI